VQPRLETSGRFTQLGARTTIPSHRPRGKIAHPLPSEIGTWWRVERLEGKQPGDGIQHDRGRNAGDRGIPGCRADSLSAPRWKEDQESGHHSSTNEPPLPMSDEIHRASGAGTRIVEAEDLGLVFGRASVARQREWR